MQAYNTQTGIVCPLDRANVDTDQIIAKQFLKSIKRTGLTIGAILTKAILVKTTVHESSIQTLY